MDHDDDHEPLVARQQAVRRRIRTAEFRAAADYFLPNQRVLDYGAGSGFMSSLIAQLGCNVEAVDVDTRPWMYWPVQLYDGVRLPYSDETFDVVFTCFALEHLPDLPACLREMSRILKSDGIMIHIVPTAAWRLWSNFTHLLSLARLARRRLAGRRAAPSNGTPPGSPSARRTTSFGARVLEALIPPRHGDLATNSIAEIGQYLLSRWRRRFAEASLEVVAQRPTYVFDVEHLLLGDISPEARVRLARCLGSSGHVFVLKRRERTARGQRTANRPRSA